MEKNSIIRSTRIQSNVDCLSPEPVQNGKNEITKCISSSNIKGLSSDIFGFGTGNIQQYGVSKSISGTNIHMNDTNTNEQSSSSASGISSPSNISNTSNKEEEEKLVIFGAKGSFFIVYFDLLQFVMKPSPLS